MNKICTSIEQSKKLIELGIAVDTADMWWQTSNEEGVYEQENPRLFVGSIPKYMMEYLIPIPAWSLAALLVILPKGKVLIDDVHSNKYKVIGYNLDTDYYDEPFDACYEMILKLKEK